MSEWQPIETAPRDGTVVWVRNAQTQDRKLSARFSDYRSPWGTPSKQWVLVREYDDFMPTAPGSLVIPDEWCPFTPPSLATSPNQ